jgi:hypothetical protein
MANSITPAGTSRSLFGVATGDIVTGGSITGASFIGAGNTITNLTANNITSGKLVVARGGTGSSSFINNAIVFNRDNQLVSDNNLSWENSILTINNRDFLSDTSNYIRSETNKLEERITNTDSVISEIITTNLKDTNANVSNYIVSTSNILIDYIKTEQANNLIYPATTRTLGGVQIGSGIYVNATGVISLTPEIIDIIPPVVEYNALSSEFVPSTDYKVYKFIYNSTIGTTFDRGNASRQILPVWCKFIDETSGETDIYLGSGDNINRISTISSNIDGSNIFVNDGIRRVKNSGYMGNILTDLELYGDVNVRPNVNLRNIEYMPLDTTYLEFNYILPEAEPIPDPPPDPLPLPPLPPPPSFGKFENDFDVNSMFRAYNNWALTFSLWLNIKSYSGSSGSELIIFELSNNDSINSRKLNINYADNKLSFYMDKIRDPVIIVSNIFTNTWYHISWSIEKGESTFEVIVYINGVLRDIQYITNDYVFALGFNKYTKNTISSAANTTASYNLCVSDFKIYNYALADDEKKELYMMNEQTRYNIEFKDTRTICDIMAYGGGGGGCGANSNYGGGAGKLVYVNDAYISSGMKTITVGRGGSAFYSNQFATRGKNTTFESLVADGGGAVMNKIFDYQVASNILYVSNYTVFQASAPNVPINRIFASNYIIFNTFTCNMASNIIGGCGSGNFGQPSPFTITDDIRSLVGYTSNIYFRGNAGGEYGGGGVGTAGTRLDGGEGLFGLNLVNINIDTDKYFNYSATINFKNDFHLTDNTIGELSGGQVYIGCGGAGSNLKTNEGGTSRLGYNSINSGCGGNYGENGRHGALLLRYLTRIDKKIVPGFVGETSNYVLSSSNNLISYVNNLMSVSGALLWAKETSNIYYSLGNVGIGVEPSQFKLEVAGGSGTTPEDATYTFGIHTSNYSNIDVVQNITNTDICAKFNSSIWTTGNVISSSDERIKTNIGDVQDDNALRMILNIEPKTYNYIDTQRHVGERRVYGFIAQQIREVIPDAVKIQTEFIPNIFVVADYNPVENIITLPNPIPSSIIALHTSRVKCYMRDTMLIVEVIEVISPTSFKIKNINLTNLTFNNNNNNNKIFVYGTEVNDFHALNKEYINTLNVCAVQELHRKIESQQGEIRELNDKVNVLLNYIDMSKMSALEDEINLLKSRYDLLINYIDLSR